MEYFGGRLNIETRLWHRCQTITYFRAETLRAALHKLFEWVHYMDETKDYIVQCVSLSWSDGVLLITYTTKDQA
jgi:hypothetical protein